MRTLILGALLLTGCKSQRDAAPAGAPSPAVVAPDREPAADAPSDPWPELADHPKAEALRVITLPTRSDVPRFDVGGPVVIEDIAVVASSQFGFAAVDWRRGSLAWTRPAGIRVAPPLAKGPDFVLIGACLNPPEIPDTSTLLGCLRVVTAAGADQAYLAIHGKTAAVDEFAGAAGPQQVWLEGERTVRWRRGDAAVAVDILTGVAIPAATDAPPIVVTFKGKRWDIVQLGDDRDDGRAEDRGDEPGDERGAGRIVARQGGRQVWSTDHAYTALLGAVWLPEQSPMIRMANISAFGGTPEVRLLDIDATGSMNGQAAWTPVPGISLLGHAISPVGDVAVAIRLDKSIKRDFIAAYAANALLMYVYPLPVVMRADPVGVAIALDRDHAPEAVVVFHDGDLVTVLPPLSSPPTAPGAARGPSPIPTP